MYFNHFDHDKIMKINDEKNVMLKTFQFDIERNNMNQKLIEIFLIQSK